MEFEPVAFDDDVDFGMVGNPEIQIGSDRLAVDVNARKASLQGHVILSIERSVEVFGDKRRE